jgi:hypothetical protein
VHRAAEGQGLVSTHAPHARTTHSHVEARSYQGKTITHRPVKMVA